MFSPKNEMHKTEGAAGLEGTIGRGFAYTKFKTPIGFPRGGVE